jgi:hypothetical protein
MFCVLLIVYYSTMNFFLFILKLHNLQNYENMKKLNYDQKVLSV